MPGMETLQELLVHELQDLYNAENQIIKALPRMAKRTTSTELREAFEEHLSQTEMQAQRLERALALLDAPVRGRNCDGMQGILEEGKKLMEEDSSDDVLNAGLIAAAQKVEHYEIASYGSVKAWAELLGQDEITALLEETLEEEEAADKKLSELAESTINPEAAMENSDAEGDEVSGSEDEEEGETMSSTTSRRASSQSSRSRKPNTPARQSKSRRR
jgi:ferritin-like metal-binding protein YciE